MEFLDKIGESVSSFIGWFLGLYTRLFGSSNDRQMRRLGFDRRGEETTIVPGSLLDTINKLEPEVQKLTDEQLKQTAVDFRARLATGETLDDLLPEMFARVREVGVRILKMRHYDVQMIGGYVLHKGNIAEMVTGEGKTLVATLAVSLNAVAGHVHVITVNDYLALRDMEWMAPLYQGLGLTVSAIQGGMDPHERQPAYACDITYGTNNEFGFDYLRDNMKPTKKLQVQGPLQFAVIDEVDNILIDEARTPLIISGPAYDDVTKYAKANRIAVQLKKGEHFEVKEKEHSAHLTDEGVRKAEELAGVESFYTTGNMEWPHLIDNALKAHFLYKRDTNYVVQEDEVVIVDEFTGRLMPGRNWSDGLHQAVEAKEGVKIKEENQTLATITLQNFFKLYDKLGGMTGTAMTEAGEFWKIYKLDVVAIPTNRPMQRINSPDMIYRTDQEKYHAIGEEIREVHKTGRPILVGTTSIEKSELLSRQLSKYGVKHEVLNAKQHGREADIIAQAGRLGGVTIATNMAGRGTDIILGGNPEAMAWEVLKHKYESRLDVPKAEFEEVANEIAQREGMADEGKKVSELGGLHVIGTERHEARRIDLQLRGRSGRQGDRGSSRFFLSLEDDLMRIFAGDWVKDILTRLGMQEGEAIESRMVSKRVEGAQKKREEYNFEVRKNLLEYDEVMDEQRKRVYGYRQHILDGGNCRELIMEMVSDQVRSMTAQILDPAYGHQTAVVWAGQELGVDLDFRDVKQMNLDDFESYVTDQAQRQSDVLIQDQIEENLPNDAEDKREWNWLTISKWANARYGLNTNDRELRKVGRDDLFEYLLKRAHEAIERFDLTPLKDFLSEDWSQRSLAGWLEHRFSLRMDPKTFNDIEVPDAIDLILEKLETLYHEKEINFPVTLGINKFLAGRGSNDRPDREGLISWANERFESKLDFEDIKSKSRDEVVEVLNTASRGFYRNGELLEEADEILKEAYGDDDDDAPDHPPENIQPLEKLSQWTQEKLHAELDAAQLQTLPRSDARRDVQGKIDERYRPELSQAERALILEVLDTAWKDHLYYMDHLRSGIGLQSYAQKDPKVEYKKQGMRAFETMWTSVADRVTDAIFRLEEANPEFLGSLWKVSSTVHESAPKPEADMSPGQNAGSEQTAIEPIRNHGKRVGRNEPCPCGSGKKFKNCCMHK